VWREAKKLRPGHYIEHSVDGISTQIAFWQPTELLVGRSVLTVERQAVEQLDQVLADSVRSHLIPV
jgi:asparagine synthetase B (glutamine-hydrolysing)